MTESLATRISTACAAEGRLTTEEILGSDVSLSALGVTSLALLRLIDAVEERFDVLLDLGGSAAYLDSLPLLVGHVDARLAARVVDQISKIARSHDGGRSHVAAGGAGGVHRHARW